MSAEQVGHEEHRGHAGESGWDVDPDDDAGVAVVEAVGRQLKLWREAAGMRPAEFAAAVGYGENLVYKIERGARIPRPEFLDRADQVLGAGGKISAMKRDVARSRYPKRVRSLPSWRRKPSRSGRMAATTCTACCRPMNTRGLCSSGGGRRTRRKRSSGWCVPGWTGIRSLTGRRPLRSASSRKR